MRKERQVMFGLVVMAFFMLAGIVSSVAAAGPDQLQLEVRLLERINQLNLTDVQIEQILPVLKKVDTILDTTKVENDKLLAQQKELLLQRNSEQAKALENQLRVLREKAMLEVKQVLLDLQMVLTDDQKAMLKKKMAPGFSMGMTLPVPEGIPGGEKRISIIVGKYNPPTQGTAKPKDKDKNYLDVNNRKTQVEDPADGRMPEEVIQILLKKKEARLAELQKAFATAEGSAKEVLEKNIADLKQQIAELKAPLQTVIDGNNKFVQPGRMGLGRSGVMMAPGQQIKEWAQNRNMVKPVQKIQPERRAMGMHIGGLQDSTMLKNLIKVLEEMQAAN